MAADFDAIARPHLEALLEPGERIEGILASSMQKTFSGGLYALAVTDRRLIVQQMRGRGAKGEPVSIRPEELVEADVDGAGGGWWTAPAAILDAVAVSLTLRTTDGATRKLKMMRAGGGETQRQGILALADWMRRRESLSG
ncbi:MAG: hypothetical protein QOJ55_1838 [Solirubrobacteraceae bacterium]|nr:hypothetical protein [Solirubrobacteraceae bacterium]